MYGGEAVCFQIFLGEKGFCPGMSDGRYSMSFTTGSLFHRESVQLAALYLAVGNWNVVRDQVIAENLLQARTMNTRRRIYSEVVSRLKQMSDNELAFLVEATHQDQACLLWLAVCRRYRFIADFAVEVLHERYITLKHDLHHEEYDSFYNRKSEWHSELEAIRPNTRNKLRQVLFKMLREADFLTTGDLIQGAMLSPALVELILKSRPADLLYLPIFESDLKGIKR